MDFAFDEQEEIFAATLRRYARERLATEYALWDGGAPYSAERLRELGELGITGLRIPQEYGGAQAPYVMVGIAAEELARGDFNYTLFVQTCAIAADIIAKHASEPLRRAWLTEMATGERMVAFALTEPGAGSDAAAIVTKAVRDGGDYVLNGEKASTTFAGLAQGCIVFARMGGAGARGVGALLVPLDAPGVSRRVYSSLGERLTQRGSLIFDNVRVPSNHLLGEEGEGFYQAMRAFDYNRAVIALACIGAAEQSLEEVIEWAKQRTAFGRPLAEHEGVSFQIAEHLTSLEAARLLAYRCLSLCDKGRPHTKEAAMAKLLGARAAADAIHSCIILQGWPGYGRDLPFEQRLRDVIGLEIGDGTPEIMKGVIAREAFGRQFRIYR